MRLSNRFAAVPAAIITAATLAAVAPTASAYTLPDGCVQITAAQMRQYLGDTIAGQYLKTDDTYASCEFAYFGESTILGTGISPDGNYLSRPVLIYSVLRDDCPDINTTRTIAPTFVVSPYCNFDNVTYCDWGYSALVDYNKYSLFSLSTARLVNFGEYNYNSHYYADMMLQGNADGTGGGWFYTSLQSGYRRSLVHQIIDSDTPASLDFGDATLSNYQYDYYMYFAVICPIINSDYTYSGVAPPDTSSGSGGKLTGDLSGTVDGTSINIDVDVDVSYPDYFEHGTYSTSTQPIYTDISNAISSVDVSGIVSGVDGLTQYDASAIWYALGLFTAGNVWIIPLIVGLFGICLLGWILTR